jgi:hypothetical protein
MFKEARAFQVFGDGRTSLTTVTKLSDLQVYDKEHCQFVPFFELFFFFSCAIFLH